MGLGKILVARDENRGENIYFAIANYSFVYTYFFYFTYL